MSIKNVALLGADGKLGPSVLHSLIDHDSAVTVLKRASSSSKDDYPSGVQVARIPDDFDVSKLTDILKGQDAVVVTIKGSQVDAQSKLAKAAVKAGVKRFIPADWGSTDSSSEWAQDLVPLFKRKSELRAYLTQLAKDNPHFSWTSVVCGHFFDWFLAFLHIWLEDKKAHILDDGEVKWSASTLSRIGEAAAKILLKPEENQNQMVYIQSFCVSQNEVIKAYEKATSCTWKIERFDSKQYENEQKAKADDGDLDAIEDLVWLLGALDANWERKQNFANDALGLKNEDLDEVVRRVVRENQ